MISNAKLFADDASLFSVIHDVNTSAKELNDDLKKINDWVFQWKMSFNPDPSKKAQEVIFSGKSKRLTDPPSGSMIVMSLKPFLKSIWVSY